MFNVTYDITTFESAEDGDVAESGFLGENLSLRKAVDLVGGVYGLYYGGNRSWYTADAEIDYRTGEHTMKALHAPLTITPSSLRRLQRILGK